MPDLDPATHAKNVADLGFAESAVQAMGYSTSTVGDNDPSVTPELVVALSNDGDGRPRTLQMSFIPAGDAVEHTMFLQCFSPLPFRVGPDSNANEVRQAIAILNEHLAIGRFGMQHDGTLYYQYVLATPKYSMIDDDMLGEVVTFIDFHQENFGDYLEGVCDGEISVLVLDNVIAQAG